MEAGSTAETLQSPRCQSFGFTAGATAIGLVRRTAKRSDWTNSKPIDSELTARTYRFLLPSLTASLKLRLASGGSLSAPWLLLLRHLPALSLQSASQCAGGHAKVHSAGWLPSLAAH